MSRNVLNPNFHTCRCCAMLLDSCISAGKIRWSHSHHHGGSTAIFHNKKYPKALLSTTVEAVGCLWTPDSVLGSSDTVILTVGEFGHAFFRTKNVLELISTTVEVFWCLWTHVSVLERSDNAVFIVVEVVQASFSTRNILKPHNCRCCAMLEDSCISAVKIT